MPPTFSTRSMLLLVPCQKLASKASPATWFHKSMGRLASHVESLEGPLTFASLGYKNEIGTGKPDKVRIGKQNASSFKESLRLGQPLRSGKVKPVVVKKSRKLVMAPFAAKSFSELGLPPLLLERLEAEGFNVPTDVQSAAIPMILENHDVVIQSYTGSGKTLAYLLPILSEVGPFRKDSLDTAEQAGKKTEIDAVIEAPSRELGMQIVREVEKLLGPSEKNIVQQLVGGTNRSRQEEALTKNKPAIVVGTPGRIAEICAAGKLHTHNCRFLILDEVDELLSFNYREDMHRILEHVGRRSGMGGTSTPARKSEHRIIMVSATVPFSVMRAARSWGNEPLLVQADKIVELDSTPTPRPIVSSNSPVRSNEPIDLQSQKTAVTTAIFGSLLLCLTDPAQGRHNEKAYSCS